MKKRRVIITKLPQAKSGVEVKLDGLRAGLGFNANVMPWPVMAGKMSEPDTEARRTLGPVPRNMANLEAEKDEIAMIPDKGGIPSTFIIGGKRHHSGGTPLFLPSDSFIFSDTAKMRIKDPIILEQFGMPPKKGGYTPAEIAKKYDINKYKKVLADPNTDRMQRETAELMIANNNLKLAKLAIYQESMKGFPQGMPQVGMPYLEEMGVDPAQFVQENPGRGQDDTEEADNMSRFGGPYLPKAEWGRNTASKMLPKFGEYSPNAGASDAYANVDTKQATEGVSGVEGVEGKGPTGKYQDWELIKKKKAGISGIAKAEGILTGLRGAQAFGNAREMQALDKTIKDKSFYDNAVNPIQEDAIGRQGSGVFSGMATGTKDPYNTGNLVQQPGMNYAISKFGGDIDYFAPGGYIPRAQTGKIVPGFYNQEDLGEFVSASPHYASAYKAFLKAFNSGNTEEMKNTASFLKTVETPWYSASWLPHTHEDKLQDLAGILEERSRGEQNISTNQSPSGRSSNILKAQQNNENIGSRANYINFYLKQIADKNPDFLEGARAANLLKKFEDYNPYYKERLAEEATRNRQTDEGYVYSPADASWYTGKEQEEINKTYDYLKNNFKDIVAGKKKLELGTTPVVAAPVDQSTIAGSVMSGAADTAKAAKADTAKVVTTDDTEALKKAAALKNNTETQSSTGQPAKRKTSIPILEEERFGGTPGKRRVLIHSLGEYKMGGALPKAEDGATVNTSSDNKRAVAWIHGKDGKYYVKYNDGSKGTKAYDKPIIVEPYKGKDHPTQYSAEDWLNFALDANFEPKSDDPVEQAKELQRKLWDDPNWGEEVKKLHLPKEQGGFGAPRAGVYDDGLLGERWEQLLKKAPKKGVSATPPVKDDKKGKTPTDNNIYSQSLNKPRLPNVPARFTLQDTLKGANLMADYLGIKGSQPWSAKAPFYTADTGYLSPERQYQKIGEQFNIAAQNLAQFGDPRQYNARLGQLQGQALAAIADTAARTEGENVRIQNAQSAQNAAALNQYNQVDAARRTRDYENYVTARDTVDNQKKFARNAGVNQLANAFTNRANIYNINQLYPQYAVDPTGMLYFKNPRDIKPDYSKQMNVNDYFNKILEENENLRNEKGMVIAYDMAKNMAGVKPKSDQADEWLKQSRGIIPSYNVNPYGYGNEQGS